MGEQLRGSPAGKISGDAFERLIAPRLGAPRADVLAGPAPGLDAGVVDLGAGQVLAVTTDPIFIMPELGWQRAGWLAVHILASDAATSGLCPSHLTVDLNLPTAIDDGELGALWDAIHLACEELGVAVIGGHTGRYDGCCFPMAGGATMLSLGPRRGYLTSAMACPGDSLIITKGAAIETAAMFGALAPEKVARELGTEVAQAAAALFHQTSVVRDARVAVAAGVHEDGVSALHDVAEGGIWGALLELAQAAGVRITVDRSAIPVRPEAGAICQHFGIDPFTASGGGALLITARPARAALVLDHLHRAGIEAAICGELATGAGVCVRTDGHEQELVSPVVDRFWPALREVMAWEERA